MYSGVHSRICVTLLVGVALLCGTLRCAWSLPSCRYVDRNNAAHLVDSVQEAPIQYRERVECEGDAGKALVAPEEVKMRGAVGKTVLRTEMGSFEVRWPRSIEQCFGKSPARATAEAAAALNRALKSAWFADSVKYSRPDWSLVFTDHATALREFPLAISRGGHPGFMVPPASIYLIADVISPGCAKGGVADGALIQVLLHEMGHAVEHLLLGSAEVDADRARAEGFASWFEEYASQFSQLIPAGSVWEGQRQLAIKAGIKAAQSFKGTAEDYAVASLPFRAIVNRRGVQGLMQVYARLRGQRGSLHDAAKDALGWNSATLEREVHAQLTP